MLSHYRRQTANLQTRIHIYNVGSILGCQSTFHAVAVAFCVSSANGVPPPITARRNGVWDRRNIAVLRLVPHPTPFSRPLPRPSRTLAISTRCPKQTLSPKNPRKTIVLAVNRRLSKGQPRNATLQHHARDILGNKLHQARGIYPIHLYETQTDRRCICLARPDPAACPVGVEGRYRLQPLSLHIFFPVSHVTSPPPMSPSPRSRYQTNLQIRCVPARLPPSNLTPRTQYPSGTSPSDSGRFAKIRANPDARRHPFASRASRACVSHLFTV